MLRLRRHLEREGFDTWSTTYPSRRMGVADLARTVAERIRTELPRRDLFAVTHSLGGILVRQMADTLPIRRVVMLAPPNGGSRLARTMRASPLFQWFYGPAGSEVADGAPWPTPRAPFAVIAGTRAASIANPTSWLRAFPADVPNDGTVSVEETRLEGMTAFATVDATHTWIMDHPEARARVVEFLRTVDARSFER